MVALTVTVTDAAGRCVAGLSERDFAVHEEGVPQTLSLFGAHEVPADVALVLDTSGSMGMDLPRVKRAAQGLVSQLRPDDRAAVVAVKDAIEMPQPLTADHAHVIEALDRLRARGSTAMYDGLYTALRDFERSRRKNPETRRQALVLLSDGFDNSSHMTVDDVSELARRLDVTIYTVTLRNGREALPKRGVDQSDDELNANYAMRSLARDTGGLAFFPMDAGQLEAIYGAIGRELISQYSLGYVPSSSASSQAFRRVSVRVLPPAQGTARTRSGYLARGTAARPRVRTSNNPTSGR
jgi:VWFA-related protein